MLELSIRMHDMHAECTTVYGRVFDQMDPNPSASHLLGNQHSLVVFPVEYMERLHSSRWSLESPHESIPCNTNAELTSLR